MFFSVFQKNQVLGYSLSTLLWHRCYYPHRSRDSVSPVCGIFYFFLEDRIRKQELQGKETRGKGTNGKLRDTVLSLLDMAGIRAVLMASVNWASAFSRTDPTKTITKFINMGLTFNCQYTYTIFGDFWDFFL